MRRRWLFSPPSAVVLSFAGAILIGYLLFRLPWASAKKPLTPIDAFFLATSAVCVTGLTPIDPGNTFSPLGQIILLALIQIGGLGYMTLSAFSALILRKRLALIHRHVLSLSYGELVETRQLLYHILTFTFLTEFIGALILFLAFHRYDFSLWERIWFSVFHSVSAFCNAGFDVFGFAGGREGWESSLRPFSSDAFILFPVLSLIILGGIGFPVIAEVVEYFRGKRVRWSLHARVVVVANLILWFGGALFILLFEASNPKTLGGQPFPNQVLSALFQSVTARTAGFSTVPTEALTASSLWLLCLWMFVGASPGGTGGGIKTTTAVVLSVAAYAGAQGKDQVTLFHRSISPERVSRAATFAFFAAHTVGIITLLLCWTERHLLTRGQIPFGFISLLFEVVSAFGTVGLSTGITPLLSPWGKLLLAITMFLGRVGLLTVLVVFIGKRQERVRYPTGEILVG